jgi:hypothetical protein
MERNSVITNYASLSDNVLISTAQNAYDNLIGNKRFIFAEGRLPAFLTSINTLYDAKSKASNEGKVEMHAKNVAKKALQDDITDIARIVNLQAKGDMTILKSSGLPLRKESENHPEFPAPSTVKLKSGIGHGEIVVDIPAEKNSRLYCIYHAPMPAPDDMKKWDNILSTKHRTTIVGLVPGTQQAVRAGYIGTNGKINLSGVFTIFVQ